MPHLPRLRRRTFFFASVAAWLVFFAVREGLGLERIAGAATVWAAVQLLVLTLLTVARLHDRGRSGWALTAALIPLVGALWLWWETAWCRGTRGANRYGPDPRERRGGIA